MPTDLDLKGLRKMLAEGGTQLIEVLPEKEYTEEHLPGALNIPLKSMGEKSVVHLDRGRSHRRLLLGRHMRHESASCVAARSHWIHRRLRLRQWEGRVDA